MNGMLINTIILAINQENLMASLDIMAKGMLGIFVVIGLLALCVFGLTKIGNKSNKKD